MKQTSRKYSVGQRVEGRVEALLPYGVFVRLIDGTQAYIRRRELTWSGNIDPRKAWQEGERIKGEILKLADSGQSMELSHRATLPDPWDEFLVKYQQGDVVEGIVKSLARYAIFVEVIPGVDGVIPLRELATWEVHKPEDMFWVGDTVEAVITHLDRRTKKLQLSIRARMRQLEVVAGIMEDFDLFSQADEPNRLNAKVKISSQAQRVPDLEPEIDPRRIEKVGRILVIDDHDEIRLPLVEWLRHRGYNVDEAKDANEACHKALSETYNLMFVDLNLPGTDGLTFLRRIGQRGIKCNTAIMSTADWLAEHSTEIEEIGVIEAFVKPLDLDEIERLLFSIGQGVALPLWQMTLESTRIKAPESYYRVSTAVRTKTLLADKLKAGLQELLAITPAEMGFIFRLHPISRIVSITTQVGKIDLNEEAIHALGASPVRDVIEEGEPILENRMNSRARERFRKLLDLIPFESCIGVPIEARGEIHRAVFLMHRRPNVFNRYHLRDVLATSTQLAVAIEREAMEQRFRSLNKLLLTGQLARGFSHEVYNKMSGLEIQLRNLQLDCHSINHRPNEPINMSEMQQAADSLLTTFNDLKDTVELFQQLMRTEEEQSVGINCVIKKTIALLQPVVREQRIRIETELNSGLPDTVGSALQLQQVFLNIILNAAQHMALKPGAGKILNVTTTYQDEDKERPIKIRLSDTGPGIHQRLWEKIFDLGFTTRLGGTGQGLYIARCLVESLDGKILVERSVVPLGTTFLIELPISYNGRG